MLAKRIIPTLLVRGQQLVKGKQFKSWRSVGHAEQAARIYAQRGVDELVILDIAATPEGRDPDFEMVKRMTDGNFCPVSVGGGVRTVEDVRQLLASGADKVVIGTAALSWSFIRKCAEKFGNQAICVSIDMLRNGKVGKYPCQQNMDKFPRGGTNWKSISFAKRMQQSGAGEILLQSVERDGMMQGYDLEMIKAVSSAVDIPVIASGGCGSYEDMYLAIQAGADAVAASSLFLFTDCTPRGAAEYLSSRGVTCRI